VRITGHSSPTRNSRFIPRVIVGSILVLSQLGITPFVGAAQATDTAPPPNGYFSQVPNGGWSSLPSGTECEGQVHRSTWEPRPDNTKRNHVIVDASAVHASFAARPRAGLGTYDPKWDSWLLPRVDGHFSGTTDEIFQWAACKWGLTDNMLRGQAVRESTWYQFEAYPKNRCVTYYGCGDFFATTDAASKKYCDAVARYGYDYQPDYVSGQCPKTFSIVGEMDWWSPTWGFNWPDNQNGTFPFNRDSTAFAVDYLGAALRGCYEGWQWEFGGSYAAGDIWGCVGAWYSGGWHDAAADGYISRVQNEISTHRWLDPTWPTDKPGCDNYGCPGPDTLGGTDTLAPVTTITCDGSACLSGQYVSPVTVVLAATDAGGSGVASTHYTTDGTAPTLASPTYSAPFTVAITTTVKFRSWDNAGNVEATQSQTIQVGASTMSIALTKPVDGSSFGWRSKVAFAASVSDDAEISKVVFYVDGVTMFTDTTYPYSATWRPGKSFGSHVVTAAAFDVTGNTVGSAPANIMIT
jgi:hypothetical protein